MASRFWVGGTGSWDASDTTHWSATSGGAGGQSVPTSSDDVTFDTASNATGYTCTITATATCANLTIGNPASGSLTLAGSSALDVYGNFNTANITRTYTGTITFRATTTGKTLTFNGETMASATVFDGVGGGWTVQDNWNNGTANITLTRGTLDTNGKTITCGAFSSSNSNTRTLTLGASTINCGSTGTAWNLATVTNLTFNVNTSTITLTGSGGDFSGGARTYNVVTFTGAGDHTISGANTFGTLTITGTASKTNVVQLNASQTVTGTLTINGNSSVNRILLRGNGVTMTAATVSMSNIDIQALRGAGAGSWNLSAITGLSGDCGGNVNITFTTPVTNYWVGGTGNWDAVAKWASTSGGVGGTGRVPLVQDTAIFNANSFSAGSQVVTQNMTRIGTVDWTGATNTPTWTTSTTCSVFGSITLISGMVLTASTQVYTFEGVGAMTLTSAGNIWAKRIDVDTVWSVTTGTLTLLDDFACAGMQLITGTFTATTQNVTSTQSIFFFGYTPLTVNMGSGTWEFTGTGDTWALFFLDVGMTLNAGTSTIKISNASATNKTFYGGGATYNTVWFTGAGTGTLTFADYGNVFNEIKIDTAPKTVRFAEGETFVVTTLTATGTAGNLIALKSTTDGIAWNLSKSSGVVSCDYLSLQDSHVLGGATFYAGANSTNVSGNTGWHFNIPDGTGNFNPFLTA